MGVREAKAMLGVTSRTLRRYTASGRLPDRRSPGGHRIFSVAELEAILHRRGAARVSEVLERLSSMRESPLAVKPRKVTSNVNSRDFEIQPRIEWWLASSLMWHPGYPTAAQVSGEHSWLARIPRSPNDGSPTKNVWLALALASSSNFCLLMG